MLKIHRLFFVVIAFLIIWSVLIEPRWVAVRHLSARLPQSAKLKIAIVSDWHFTQRPLWRIMTPNHAKQIVNKINDSKPDVILILGDLIAEENQETKLANTPEDEIATVLGKLKATQGVYAVLGNHDWWYDGKKIKVALEKHGITVLENEAKFLKKSNLWLVGIGDHSTNHTQVNKAFSQVPKNSPAIVMMHDPASFAEITPKNALFFAGHTHGGQVYLPWLGALIVPGVAPRNWAYGWIQHHRNWMYVTSGLGVSIFPIRFNMRPEFVLLNI